MPDPTYPGAPDSLIATWNQRRRPLGWPRARRCRRLEVDLAALLAARVPADEAPPGASAHAVKRHEIRGELAGHTELAALNALLIAHLRKRHFPRHAPRCSAGSGRGRGPALLAELPPRWLISSVITFGDHGTNEEASAGRPGDERAVFADEAL
jgi:hypothetical protein